MVTAGGSAFVTRRRAPTWIADQLAARAENRFDELIIRVAVSPAHQLVQRLDPVGPIVELAPKVEGSDRIVARANREDACARNAAQGTRVADNRAFRRERLLAD